MVFKDIFECVQVDLIDYPRYKGANSGHQYILVVIDCLSKYAWTRSLTKKTAKRTAEALDSIFGEMPRLPTMMASDKGLEMGVLQRSPDLSVTVLVKRIKVHPQATREHNWVLETD